MKRSTKIITGLVLFLVISIWSLNFVETTTVLIPYVTLVIGLALHAAYTILSFVFTLKDHP